jgi:hypothetical protein
MRYVHFTKPNHSATFESFIRQRTLVIWGEKRKEHEEMNANGAGPVVRRVGQFCTMKTRRSSFPDI